MKTKKSEKITVPKLVEKYRAAMMEQKLIDEALTPRRGRPRKVQLPEPQPQQEVAPPKSKYYDKPAVIMSNIMRFAEDIGPNEARYLSEWFEGLAEVLECAEYGPSCGEGK